jgi:hypothetical protein
VNWVDSFQPWLHYQCHIYRYFIARPSGQERLLFKTRETRVARFFLTQYAKNGGKYTLLPLCKLPNGHSIYQMSAIYILPMGIKYTNIVHSKTLPNLPKLGFLACKYTIWQPWGKLAKKQLTFSQNQIVWIFLQTCFRVKRREKTGVTFFCVAAAARLKVIFVASFAR